MPTLIHLAPDLGFRVDQEPAEVVRRLATARLDGKMFVSFQTISDEQVLIAVAHVLALEAV